MLSSRGHHPAHQLQRVEIRQHVIDRVIHGVEGVHQGGVPVKQDHRWPDQPHNRRVPVRLDPWFRARRWWKRAWPDFRRRLAKGLGFIAFQQRQQIHQVLEAVENRRWRVPVGKPAVDSPRLPASTVVEYPGHPGFVGRQHVHVTVTDIPGTLVSRQPQGLEHFENDLRVGLVLGDIVGADRGVKQMLPPALIHRAQLPVEKFPVTVGGDRQPHSHGFQGREVFVRARLERLYLAKIAAIRRVVGLVGNQFGVSVIAKNGVENVGPGHPAFGQYAWVQPPENPDVSHQPGVVRRAATVLRQQPLHQTQLFQLRQHVFHGAEHSIVGVYQGAMPVENQDRWRLDIVTESGHQQSLRAWKT